MKKICQELNDFVRKSFGINQQYSHTLMCDVGVWEPTNDTMAHRCCWDEIDLVAHRCHLKSDKSKSDLISKVHLLPLALQKKAKALLEKNWEYSKHTSWQRNGHTHCSTACKQDRFVFLTIWISLRVLFQFCHTGNNDNGWQVVSDCSFLLNFFG